MVVSLTAELVANEASPDARALGAYLLLLSSDGRDVTEAGALVGSARQGGPTCEPDHLGAAKCLGSRGLGYSERHPR